MENASKALLMAGEVLISLIIISALLLMINNLTSYQSLKEQNTREAQVIEFNNKYEAYNRNDIRGNDLYSLLNRAVDYNRRKSTEGTGDKDEGQYLNYEPMTIIVNFKTDDGENQTKLVAPDGKQRIFVSDKYTIDATNNRFENLFNNLNSNSYPSGALQNLANSLTKIFVSDSDFSNLKISEKKQIFYNFNSAYGSQHFKADKIENEDNLSTLWNEIKESSQIREDVYKYYEYLQFTRAHFDCKNVEYNSGTGRIVRMEFKFNGKIN